MTSIDRIAPSEVESIPLSPSYNAVPLGMTPDSEAYLDYMIRSLGGIKNKLTAAFDEARDSGWIESSEVSRILETLVDHSLYDSQMVRMQRNRKIEFTDFVDIADPRAEKAMHGVASPLELLSLLEDYPTLGSIELAKLSHPLDSEAPRAMELDVEHAIKDMSEAIEYGEPRHKIKTLLSDIPAATILRKQVISDYGVDDSRIQVVRRQAFLVRGDEEVRETDPYLDRKIRNPDRFSELTQKIESYYPSLSSHPQLRWLQPIATSYYAKYVNAPTQPE